MKKLIIDIDEKLHSQLKITAIREGKTLRELVIERIQNA